MCNIRHILLIIILAIHTSVMNAEDNELMIRLRTGHNATFGGFAAVSLETFHNFDDRFQLSVGTQYNTIGRTALEVRPAYSFDYSWGRISAEVLLSYSGLTSVTSFAAGTGAGFAGRHVTVRLGYYYRHYGHSGVSVKEPFNVFYEMRGHLLAMLEKWDLDLMVTNDETFELERHYQPSFIAECRHYPRPGLGIVFGLGCKPAGIFNISADNYQSFLNLGVCYRW